MKITSEVLTFSKILTSYKIPKNREKNNKKKEIRIKGVEGANRGVKGYALKD
jgi:hypothetical protein